MNSIGETFEDCRRNNQKALIPFLTSGYPNKAAFIRLVLELSKRGADLIEIGIPFSDPLADGKTIQASSQVALKQGVSVARTLDYLEALEDFKTPLIIMSYFNPLFRYGLSRFIKRAYAAGVRGLIIPDIIPEEGHSIEEQCQQYGIELIYLIAPTTGESRSRMILRRSKGFVYLVSVAGVTGARKNLPSNLVSWIRNISKKSKIPVCVGFGISTVKQAQKISGAADGIIIGSAIIDRINRAPGDESMICGVGNYIEKIKKGINHA